MNPAWFRREAAGSFTLSLHIQPGAKKTEIIGLHGDALKIRLAAPPMDGKANECLIAFLAEELGVPRAQVELASGASSRRKRLRINGASAEAIARFLTRMA
jgi:uncharacterized protein (TIGR00251 family)